MTVQEERKLERVDARVLQSVLLDEIAGRLADLDKLISSTIPQGVAESYTLEVTSTKPQQIRSVAPWFNVSIYNDSDSANTVYVMINKENADAHPVEPDETYNVLMNAPKIVAIYFKIANAGESATVKVSAVR